MFIGDLFEDGSSRRIVVTYPGRFQPFHLGHAEVFRSLQSKFGADNVFIVTSNKVDGEKSPFNFSDKVRFMHAAGIPDHSIIEASQVYKLPDQFDGQKENLIFVVAVGEPDKQRLNPGTITKKTGGPSYFQNLPEDLDQAEMSDRHGYVVVASERQKTVSIGGKQYDVSHGTEVRKLWNHIRNSPEQRQAFMKQLYGRSDPDLANILDKIPQSMAEEGGVGVVKAGDKRYSNALTVDVKPDTLGKEMKAYGLVGRKSPSTQQQKVGKGVGKGVYDGVAEDAENFNGIDISLEIQKDDEYVDDEDYDNQVIYVTASSKGKELGHVLFAFDGEYLMPQDLEVEERYRGQGIAQTMYDYVKSKGYKIRRSGQQTDAGAGFWDKHKPGKNVWEQGVAEDIDLEERFNIIESMIEYWAEHHGVDSDVIWEDLEEVDDEDLLSEAEAWQTSRGKNKNGGLNKKGVSSYRSSHPGSHLQTAVTTKPSKLKPGSKAAKRRKSFCARMKGMKKHRTGSKTARDPNSRINKSLRKWNCH